MKLSFEYNGRKIEFDLIYSKRKTISIKITPPGIISVIAPLKTKETNVIALVKDKSSWIIKKLDEIEDRETLRPIHNFQNGDTFLYLGIEYKLSITVDKPSNKRVLLDMDTLHIVTPENIPDLISNYLELWYRRRAESIINDRIVHFMPQFSQAPIKVMVKTQKKRWGSCNARRELYFNWKIIMAPIEVIDYVVVHEMCHMIHMNHSLRFWECVEELMPDYKIRKEWLKNNGIRLTL